MSEFKNVDESAITYGIFKAEADALLRNGFYLKAIASYTTSLKLRPGDKSSLVCRSKCHLLLGDTSKALQDAEASLAEDKNFAMGMFQKAEALFQKGDFEMALVYYHRGNKLRPELQNFLIGIQKAQLSIYNCVGTPSRGKLNTTGDLSFFAAHVEKKPKRKGVLCTLTPQVVQRKKKTTERSGNEKTIKQMLGDLFGDRKFLEKLLKETDNTTKTGKKVVSCAEEGLAYLDKLADYWQQVKPIYARKYESRLALNRGRAPKISPHDYMLNETEKIEAIMTEGNYELALQKSLKLMTLLNDFTEELLSNKMAFMANISSILGNAYLELKDFEKAEFYHQQDLTIGENYRIDHAEFRGLDNLGRVYARNGDFVRAIEVWERKLPFSKSHLETAWLCHELGRCYLELEDTHVAKDYAERSLASAEEIHDDRWRLHALVLISQANVKSGCLSSALISFEKALELATLLLDSEAAAVITRAIKDVHAKILERELNRGEDKKSQEYSLTNSHKKLEDVELPVDEEQEQLLEEFEPVIQQLVNMSVSKLPSHFQRSFSKT